MNIDAALLNTPMKNKVAGVGERSASPLGHLQSIKPGTDCQTAVSRESILQRKPTVQVMSIPVIPLKPYRH